MRTYLVGPLGTTMTTTMLDLLFSHVPLPLFLFFIYLALLALSHLSFVLFPCNDGSWVLLVQYWNKECWSKVALFGSDPV